jgi:hypothetical protein
MLDGLLRSFGSIDAVVSARPAALARAGLAQETVRALHRPDEDRIRRGISTGWPNRAMIS